MKRFSPLTLSLAVVAGVTHADPVQVQMHLADMAGVGAAIGTVTASEHQAGVLLMPALTGLPPGLHGFHVHQTADCKPAEKDGKKQAAMAAGGHYDPDQAGSHAGPYATGHKGDLPALYVDADGKADLPLLAPRLKLADLKGRALVIHAGADNYADQPEKLGGGGARIACGVIK